MPTLRQGTLSFASTKRTASASIAKGKKFSHPTVVPVAKRSVSVDTISVGSTRPSWSDRDESDVDDIVVSDESGSEVHRPLKKLKIDDGKAEAVHKGKGKEVARLKEGARKVEAASAGVDASATKENLDVLQKSGKLRKHYALVSVKMGHLEPGTCAFEHLLHRPCMLIRLSQFMVRVNLRCTTSYECSICAFMLFPPPRAIL
jgi:hypothetical protein